MAEEASLSASTCPGPDAGGGLEWVLVEKLASEGGAHTAEEYVLMPVRPAADPRKAASQIVNFKPINQPTASSFGAMVWRLAQVRMAAMNRRTKKR
jgi:hypothetical protein